VFFFSSRRRHTRCYRDWSSDVCSSDLLPPGLVPRHGAAGGDGHEVALAAGAVLVVRQELGGAADVLAVGRMAHQALDLDGDGLRSEERRVGKEWGCQWRAGTEDR